MSKDIWIILGKDLSNSPSLQFKSITVWFSCCSLLHVWRPLSCLPTVVLFVDDGEPGPLNVSQAWRALPAFLSTLSFWFLAFLEVVFQIEDSTRTEQSLPTDALPGWYLLFMQPCGIGDACSVYDILWHLIPFVELVRGHPNLIFVQSIIS